MELHCTVLMLKLVNAYLSATLIVSACNFSGSIKVKNMSIKKVISGLTLLLLLSSGVGVNANFDERCEGI